MKRTSEGERKLKKVKVQYYKQFFKSIIVPFVNWYGDQIPEVKFYEEFPLLIQSKRIYAKDYILKNIVDTANIVLNQDIDVANVFIYNLLALRMSVEKGLFRKPDGTRDDHSFQMALCSLITSTSPDTKVSLLDINKRYVDAMYQHDINGKREEAMKGMDKVSADNFYKESTTFDDVHCAVLYQFSVVTRLAIPIIAQYTRIYEIPDDQSREFIHNSNLLLYKIVEEYNGLHVINKLIEYINNAVTKTVKSNKVMYDKMQIYHIVPDSIKHDLLLDMTTSIIIKYSFDQDPISLNHVVIRMTINRWVMKGKLPYVSAEISEIDGAAGDDNTVISETEMFEMFNNKTGDNSTRVVRSVFLEDTLLLIQMKYNINYSTEEYNYYMKNMKISDFQQRVIYEAFSSEFGGSTNMSDINKSAWVRLVIILRHILINTGHFKFLPHLITGDHVSYTCARTNAAFSRKIEEHLLYKKLLSVKYRRVRGHIAKRDFLKDLIFVLVNNTYSYNTFGYDMNGDIIGITNGDDIIYECLMFHDAIVK